MLTTRILDDVSHKMAAHPIVGAWMATTPSGPAPSIFAAEGAVVLGWPVTQAGPRGVTFHSGWVGMWEPTDAYAIHFTAVQVLSDANGTYTGTLTVDGHPRVSDDGQSFVDDSSETKITIRDAQGNILDAIGTDSPVTGIRMGVGSPGLQVNPRIAAQAAPAAQAIPSAANADLADLIRATGRERLRAFVAADLDILESLHADDFQLINPGGRRLTKDEYLGGVASGEIDYRLWEPDAEIAVRLYGEAAAIQYQANTEIVVGGETFVLRNWHTDVYEQRDGRWQVVWSQATSIQ